MKILVTVHGFLTPSMTFVYNQLKEYEAQGHEVLVVATKRMNKDVFPYENVIVIPEKKDLGYVKTSIQRKLGYKYSLAGTYFSTEFYKVVEEFKPDVIHVQFGTHLLRVYDAISELNTPILVTFHGYDVSQYLLNPTYVKSLSEIMNRDNVYATTVSKDMKERLGNAGINTSRVFVNYLGVDTEFYSKDETVYKEDAIVVLQVSNFVEKKGHKYTLKAFKDYINTSTDNRVKKLILAGDGPLRGEIEQQINDLNLSNNVELLGTVDKFQVKKLMDKSDCFIHHSVTAANGDMEGLPTVLMEAMSMGLTCITTYHAGIPEIIENKKTGYLTEEKNVDEIVNALLKCESTRFDTRSKIITKFNLKNNTESILDIITKVAGK